MLLERGRLVLVAVFDVRFKGAKARDNWGFLQPRKRCSPCSPPGRARSGQELVSPWKPSRV